MAAPPPPIIRLRDTGCCDDRLSATSKHARRGSATKRASQCERAQWKAARLVVLLYEDASVLPIEGLMQPRPFPRSNDAIRLELALHATDAELPSYQLP